MKRSNPIIEALVNLLENFETFKGRTDRKTYWFGVLSILLVGAGILVVLLAFSLLFFGLNFIGNTIAAYTASFILDITGSAFLYKYLLKWVIKIIFTWIPGCFFGISCALAIGYPLTMILPTITMAVRRTRDAIGTCLVYIAALAVSVVVTALGTVNVISTNIQLVVCAVCALVTFVLLLIPSRKKADK